MKNKAKTLIALCMALNINASAQLIFQNGNYNGQKQKAYSQQSGTLKEKYTSNGFNWLLLSDQGKHKIINEVNIDRFNKSQLDSVITLDSCFKINSRKWKKI